MQQLRDLFSDMSQSLMAEHSIFFRDSGIFSLFCSILKINKTIAPITNNAFEYLPQSLNFKSPQKYQYLLNHLTCILLKHYFYTCITHISYKNQNFSQSWDMETTWSILIFSPMTFNLNFPCPLILDMDSSPRKTSPPSYFSYLQNHY